MTDPNDLEAWSATQQPVPGHRPWPRLRLDAAGWDALVERLAVADWALLAEWGEAEAIHAALRDEAGGVIVVATLRTADRHFASLGAVRPAAIRFERAAQDLWGLVADGLPDSRPWLDHGRFAGGSRRRAAPAQSAGYAFLPVEGDGVHQIPVGPVHAGIIEPGHFRFHANGETVVRLEQRLGYVHKGTESLMAGRRPADAVRLASRISGDSAVAHALAFARAVEAALNIEAPPRATWLRAVMAELERAANHFGDIGAICNDAAYTLIHAHCAMLREQVLGAADACFGHRLMMDRVVPGGVARDLDAAGAERLRRLVARLRPHFADIVAAYEGKSSLLDRMVSTGVVDPGLAHRFGAGGYVGRASGHPFDARRSPGYPPYGELDFEVPLRSDGDVNARVWIRIEEARQSLRLIEQLLERMPSGPVAAPLPEVGGEGCALVEGFRGDIFTWVRLAADGTIARCHPRDPSWLQWPLLEAAIEHNIVADFPLCNKSFNCSYSGHDL